MCKFSSRNFEMRKVRPPKSRHTFCMYLRAPYDCGCFSCIALCMLMCLFNIMVLHLKLETAIYKPKQQHQRGVSSIYAPNTSPIKGFSNSIKAKMAPKIITTTTDLPLLQSSARCYTGRQNHPRQLSDNACNKFRNRLVFLWRFLVA
jgi:hypothetical protein